MLASLDPYSTYLDQEAYRILNEDLNGQFGGIGIRVTMEAGRLTVVAPLDNTPANVLVFLQAILSPMPMGLRLKA